MAGAVDAVVVGSGPNGLAAAVVLARAGLSVTVLESQETAGGGIRTLPLRAPGVGPEEGLLHDVCAAVPAAAPASQFFAEFDLSARGVELLTPEVSYAQPLPGPRSGVAYRDLDATVARLAEVSAGDARLWRRLFGVLSERPRELSAIALSDKRSVPGPLSADLAAAVAAFGVGVGLLTTRVADRVFATEEAQALVTGVAAHTIARIPSGAAAGTAVYLGGLAHSRTGWPVVRGGIGRIAEALVTDLEAHGGTVRTGHRVRGRGDLPPARAYLFDTHAHLLAPMLAPGLRRRLTATPVGAGACKIDYVLDGPVPWADPEVARAGTVHLCGTVEDMRRAEDAVAAGRHAEWPMMLVGDPATQDPSRLSPGGLRPLWTYVHVPRGSTLDVRDAADAQLERFAPGFRDRVVGARVVPAAQLQEHNTSLLDGDIAGGAISLWRMVARPSAVPDPYRVADDVYLCSGSTPPGPGVHGMSGLYAAGRALRHTFGIAALPSLAP